MNNRIIVWFIKIVVMLVLLDICACSSIYLKKEAYSNNVLYVYVKIEGSSAAGTDETKLFEEFEKQAENRALGLMIIVLEEQVSDKINRERMIAGLRSYGMKPILLGYTESDFYAEAYYRFELSGFQEALDSARE